MNPATNIIPLMPKQTKMFIPPTLRECYEYGQEIGLSELECGKFWFYFDSKGWLVGKVKMQQWKSALSGWKLRNEETTTKPTNGNVLSIQNQTALQRVEDRIKYLKGQFPLTDQKLKTEWNEMKAEQKRLMQLLGFKA